MNPTSDALLTPPHHALVAMEGVTKKFGDVVAVDDVSLQVQARELFALLGGSGSGKSTLLRMLAGFEKPTEGRIFIAGEDITDLAPFERPVNMMFQSYALFPHMTVEQNIAFGLKQEKQSKALIQERIQHLLSLVHMEGYNTRKPHQLSGGQQQRVALARSLAKRPKLLLLDEPMGALDKKLRTRMQLEVVEILEQVNATCIMVTHDQEEAMTMASRIAVMNHGRIMQTGSPMDIYETPNCLDVAGFIGSINLYEGQITVDENDHCMIESAALGHTIRIGHGIITSLEDHRIWVAVRPEKTQVTTCPPEQDYNFAKGIVHDIAYLGTHSIYHVKLPSGLIVQSHMANSERTSERPTWEDTVYIHWDDQSAIVLQH